MPYPIPGQTEAIKKVTRHNSFMTLMIHLLALQTILKKATRTAEKPDHNVEMACRLCDIMTEWKGLNHWLEKTMTQKKGYSWEDFSLAQGIENFLTPNAQTKLMFKEIKAAVFKILFSFCISSWPASKIRLPKQEILEFVQSLIESHELKRPPEPTDEEIILSCVIG